MPASISLNGRPARRSTVRKPPTAARPATSPNRAGVAAPPRSVREVRLIGVEGPLGAVVPVATGDRLSWSGRDYDVATSEPPGVPPGAAGVLPRPAYLHLTPVETGPEASRGG